MTAPLSQGFGDFAGRTWLNTAHQGALPLAAARAAQEAVLWKVNPYELTTERFEGVPRRLRGALGRLVNADPEEIVLGNSASYGLHLIANGYPWQPGDEVVVMAGDFPSDIFPWLTLERRFGVRIRRVRPTAPVLTAAELNAAITPHTRVCCVPWVHSFSGFTVDLDGLGRVCRERGVFLVVNGSQAVGVRPVDVRTLPVDALISVGFKWLCGPYGTGFVWIRPELRDRLVPTKAYWLAHLSQTDLARDDLEPVLNRSPHDLDIFGTANFLNYVPWTVAIEHLIDLGADRIRAHTDGLVAHLIDGVRDTGLDLLSPADPGERSTLVYVSHPDTGRNRDLHQALTSNGVDIAYRAGRLRASPHIYNTVDDIDRLLAVMRRSA